MGAVGREPCPFSSLGPPTLLPATAHAAGQAWEPGRGRVLLPSEGCGLTCAGQSGAEGQRLHLGLGATTVRRGRQREHRQAGRRNPTEGSAALPRCPGTPAPWYPCSPGTPALLVPPLSRYPCSPGTPVPPVPPLQAAKNRRFEQLAASRPGV